VTPTSFPAPPPADVSLAAELRRRGLPGIGWWVAGLLVVGALSRWVTRSHLVQAWDAGNFVLALTNFDLERHQPHMPGLFWLLIALGRLARPLFGGDGVKALELVNALAAAAALPFGWYLGFRVGGLRVGCWLAALLFSAPLLWFYASQPLSYGPELGWVTAIGCCAWCVSRGERGFLLPLALLMATAGGIRPNTPLFLLPLVAVCCWRGWRRGIAGWRFLAAVLLGAGLVAAWFHAFLAEVGGFAVFWPKLMSWKGDHTVQATGRGPLINAWELVKTIALTAPFGIALALLRRRPAAKGLPQGSTERRWIRVFLALWLLPSALYLVLVHFTRMGHATTLLPAVLLLLALRLAGSGRGPLAWPRDLALVLLLQCLLFLVVPGDRFAAHLRAYDREWGTAIEAVRRYDPATTLVVVSGKRNQRAYRLPSVHLPAYDHGEADLVLDQRDDTIAVRPPLRRVVFLDRGLAMAEPDLPGVRTENLLPGRLRLILVPVPAEGLEVGRREARRLPPPSGGVAS
jgi:hypothetical protein